MEGGDPVVIANAEGTGRLLPLFHFRKRGATGRAVANVRQVTNRRHGLLHQALHGAKILRGQRGDEDGPLQVLKAENGDVQIEAGGRKFSPPEISAMILQN